MPSKPLLWRFFAKRLKRRRSTPSFRTSGPFFGASRYLNCAMRGRGPLLEKTALGSVSRHGTHEIARRNLLFRFRPNPVSLPRYHHPLQPWLRIIAPVPPVKNRDPKSRSGVAAARQRRFLAVAAKYSLCRGVPLHYTNIFAFLQLTSMPHSKNCCIGSAFHVFSAVLIQNLHLMSPRSALSQ